MDVVILLAGAGVGAPPREERLLVELLRVTRQKNLPTRLLPFRQDLLRGPPEEHELLPLRAVLLRKLSQRQSYRRPLRRLDHAEGGAEYVLHHHETTLVIGVRRRDLPFVEVAVSFRCVSSLSA